MSSHVRLRIFSGLKDPQWTLEGPDDDHVRGWLARATAAGLAADPALRPVQDDEMPSTGYRGYEIKTEARTHRIYRGSLVNACPATELAAEPSIEEMLFSTNAKRLEKDFGLNPDILKPCDLQTIIGLGQTCAVRGEEWGPLTFSGPSGPWGEVPFTNCYAYANNARVQIAVFPGDGERRFTPEELTRALKADGLRDLGLELPSEPPKDRATHYIAALLQPNGRRGDYHFLRLDGNGCWSQKSDTVTDRDDASPKARMTDLCRAQFNDQYCLVGFFLSTEEAQSILTKRGGGAAF